MRVRGGTNSRWLLALTLGLVVGGGSIFAVTRQAPTIDVPPRPTSPGPVEAAPYDHVRVDYEGHPYRGPADARVTVVEFTDYECPFCARYFRQVYPTLLTEYGDRIRYVIRNYPLTSIHAHAAKAAEAAECAADQDKFWEYHDVLYPRQASLDLPNLKQYAAELGLDGDRFAACLDSGEKAEIVAADVRDGRAYGLNGTPTFFINGRKLVGAQPLAVFESYIERALQETE